ncbi:MAG: threonine synthase [Proteobacteria bacterium]|nr:threonine synthase [Pseudomonadota bacterium]
MTAPTYLSTRGRAPEIGFAEALLRGMAPDGGLYLPSVWPNRSPAEIAWLQSLPYPELAYEILRLFIGDDLPNGALRAAAERMAAFDDPAVTPCVELEPGLRVLELFHGPTAAFKDLAMQMMAPLTEAALEKRGESLLLLTATSGDTGAAAVRAFAGSQRIRLAVLHPLDRVSPVQRRQMTTSGADNVLNLAVRGDFDDCQRLVKALLADEGLREGQRLSSVNSINWGRLVGQIPYYLAAAKATGGPPRFVVPTGNFGDAFAGWAAQRIGLKAGRLTCAVNANDALARALNEGRYARRPATPTASVSMDVQAPSNFERLVFEASGRDAERTAALFETFAREGAVEIPPDLLAAMRENVEAVSIGEAETSAQIAHAWKAWGRVVCPHTAVALAAAGRVDRAEGPVVALSTAHPAKFPEAVSKALGVEPEAPAQLRGLEGKTERFEVVDADLNAVRAALSALA